jgi:hypothetical protein
MVAPRSVCDLAPRMVAPLATPVRLTTSPLVNETTWASVMSVPLKHELGAREVLRRIKVRHISRAAFRHIQHVAGGENGAGFTNAMLDSLVRDGLATAERRAMRAGRWRIEVTWLTITEDGRRADRARAGLGPSRSRQRAIPARRDRISGAAKGHGHAAAGHHADLRPYSTGRAVECAYGPSLATRFCLGRGL